MEKQLHFLFFLFTVHIQQLTLSEIEYGN